LSISYRYPIKIEKSGHYPESVSIIRVPVYSLSAMKDVQLPVKRVFSQL